MRSPRFFWPLLVVGLSCAGGTESGVAPQNKPPTIQFTFSRLAVVRGDTQTLSVDVSDVNGDPLTVTWTITRGTLTPANPANTRMSWHAPATIGLDTVVVKVSDGSLTRKVTEPIMVGTSASGAPSTFLKANSPYIISLSGASPVLDIPEEFTSTVEAGTTLLLDTEGTNIDVTGKLVTLGTLDEPVVIRPNVRNLNCGSDGPGWWGTIQVSHSAGAGSAGSVELNHTEVWFANAGVRLQDDARVVIDGSAIRCSGIAGVFHDGSGTLILRNTEVSNGKASGIVVGSDVATQVPDSVLISGCTVEFNQQNGILMALDDPGQTSVITMEYNYIANNFSRGVTLSRAVFPAMHFNSFSNNGSSGGSTHIYLENDYGTGSGVTTISATCNYFSVATQSGIDATIRDSLDNPTLVPVRVDTDPWLDADPRTTPPNCTP